LRIWGERSVAEMKEDEKAKTSSDFNKIRSHVSV